MNDDFELSGEDEDEDDEDDEDDIPYDESDGKDTKDDSGLSSIDDQLDDKSIKYENGLINGKTPFETRNVNVDSPSRKAFEQIPSDKFQKIQDTNYGDSDSNPLDNNKRINFVMKPQTDIHVDS